MKTLSCSNFPGKADKGSMASAVIIMLCKDVPVVRASKRGEEEKIGLETL